MYGELIRPFAVDPWGGHDLHIYGHKFLEKLGIASHPTRIRGFVEVLDELGGSYRSRRVDFESSLLVEPPAATKQGAA